MDLLLFIQNLNRISRGIHSRGRPTFLHTMNESPEDFLRYLDEIVRNNPFSLIAKIWSYDRKNMEIALQ